MRTDIPHPEMFTCGVNVLLLMRRAKEGGSAKTDRSANMKRVVSGPEQFNDTLAEMRERLTEPFRIYSTVTPRDVDKAIQLFKYRQLDASFAGEDVERGFYVDIKNRWISCLKDPKASMRKDFLFDIDSDTVNRENIIAEIEQKCEVLDAYYTKNGRHYITRPFNPTLLIEPGSHATLHKNALMLWSY